MTKVKEMAQNNKPQNKSKAKYLKKNETKSPITMKSTKNSDGAMSSKSSAL